jgi:hypothetical protein
MIKRQRKSEHWRRAQIAGYDTARRDLCLVIDDVIADWMSDECGFAVVDHKAHDPQGNCE